MYKKLGDYIRPVKKKNKDGSIKKLLGINIDKEFMPSQASISKKRLTKYRVVEKNQFAYSPVTSRNGDKFTIALLKKHDKVIISPAYKVFEVKDTEELIPEFLFIWFNRDEFDRYARFNSWGSARETFDWDEIREINLPIPPISVQRKYVNLYKGLIANHEAYKDSFSDLQLICDTYIQGQINKQELEPLGNYIRECDERNSSGEFDDLLGLSVEKKFIPSNSNRENLNLKNYKIVRPGQFGYIKVTSRNGDKISIALKDGEPGLISKTYTVFEIMDEEKLLPEFLFLFFQRDEFDRYARFNSWGSARETFDWEEMCKVKIPVPPIEKQEAIVTIYNALQTRKRIGKKLEEMVEPLCPVLMKGVIEELKEKKNRQAELV